MTSFHIRPRFRKKIILSIDGLKMEVENKLTTTDQCIGSVSRDMIVLKIDPKEQHYWSPQLSLMLEKHDDHTLVRGLYGPKSSVWAMFAFGYGALSVLGLFHLIAGMSMWQMGKGLLPLLSVGVEISFALGLYIAAQMGQKKGAEQLYRLHFFIEGILHEKIEIE